MNETIRVNWAAYTLLIWIIWPERTLLETLNAFFSCWEFSIASINKNNQLMYN